MKNDCFWRIIRKLENIRFMLTRVEKVTADVIVAEKLKKWIIENHLKPGDRLPTEQLLSEELGVARHTLREGIKRLSQLGIVSSKTGSGLYICDVSFENMAEYMQFLKQWGYISLPDIYSVREMLECSIVREAALHIDGEHMRIMEEILSSMKECIDAGDFDGYVQQDVAFHGNLAESTGNHLLSGIISALRQVFKEHMSQLDRKTALTSFKEHSKIAEAVRGGDAELAVERMRSHIIGTKGTYVS